MADEIVPEQVEQGIIPQAYFRFYAGLNDFLEVNRRQKSIAYPLNGLVAIKHPIEALGVPHTEVEVILANGTAVDFAYPVRSGDRISVYPAFATIDVSSLPPLRPPLPYPPHFVVDNHLGQLATYLRLLGFDARYRNDYQDDELAEVAWQEERVLLTRDRRLLMRKVVTYGYCLRSRDPREQLRAVLRRFRLFPAIQPWRRCLRCNGRLEPVAKASILDRLEPLTRMHYDKFHLCQDCQQIYWKGSHYRPLQEFIEQIQREWVEQDGQSALNL
ncbi:MAG: Mut7-C ubiquitin/RNAse domain-containing protein [Chloroflexi bacterium]|nr:Mut7-C ubiquitin/RNAse domain-containing protein [Chloroflexota bacterium]MCI0579865.1 Mut7-C ubiquitin/RNAse domain-containing protein [Chloroflexota bacterium]MCI0646146.1 Mut7-C ubiquitin/RNAse domain-containing protein [Chloroflexota bacterium]MCI0729844.1 Mut7-C ubiquitin/RNAse domain-containing protein [Chloroflexota bacterium]